MIHSYILFFVTGLVCQMSFNPTPVNTFSVLSNSEELFLNCTIHGLNEISQTVWISYVTRALGRQISANSVVVSTFAGDFQIEGTYNLVFLTRALSEAGQYECRNTGAPEINAFVEVIMLGKMFGKHVNLF